jgi:hypothetical protein
MTAMYFHLARYGEDLLRPTLAGIAIVLLSTIFYVTQFNPGIEKTFHFIGSTQLGNQTQWEKAFERSFADFIPILPLGGSNFLIDDIIKLFGGVLSFALLAIALRRKFERKFRH